jgi:hypothetical protein
MAPFFLCWGSSRPEKGVNKDYDAPRTGSAPLHQPVNWSSVEAEINLAITLRLTLGITPGTQLRWVASEPGLQGEAE